MRIAVLGLAAMLAGCAGLQVTYQSDPPGATLYEDGQPRGLTPFTLAYQPDASFGQGRCVDLKGTSVKWASGAEASTPSPLTICPDQGRHQVYTFIRPDVAGRDVDMNFALQRQRNAILATQIAPLPTYQPYQLPAPPIPQTTTCNTQRVGTQLQTICR